ncbi:MAG TPA: twin-arginine translocation signal domain-containing protein [Planctomycetes bacterium]|nr:twin-arginine translocation signal domain-containing protein [Planctomycetota bacterium]
MKKQSRRDFLKTLGAGAAGLALPSCKAPGGKEPGKDAIPPHLAGYEALYRRDPRAASRAWFKEAKFGLFMHFGLYSLLGRGEWVMLRERISVGEYEKLKGRFRAEAFDPDFITDLALQAGMKYVNLTAKHHEGFCLFETAAHDYHVKASPAGRDLVGELARACREKGLGLFLYYSYAADWRHPWFYARSAGWQNARPAYPFEEPRYKWRKDSDFRKYVDYVHFQLRELLTRYGPLAGIWFDPIMGYYARPDLFPVEETYGLVRSLQPHCLISFKQGATGTEDFAAPERSGRSLEGRVKKAFPGRPESAGIARKAWESNRQKKLEFCDTLQRRGWGYVKREDGRHKNPLQVEKMLARAWSQGANLLLNTGPLPDGSISPEDAVTLRAIGKRIGRTRKNPR